LIKLSIAQLQKILQKPIKRHYQSLGLDIATRTGWALIKTNSRTLTLDYGFYKAKTTDLARFNEYVQFFWGLIKKEYHVVIEDCYYKRNAGTLKLLAKLESIAYTIAYLNGCKTEYIEPSTARYKMNCKAQKDNVHKWILDNLKIDIADEDASDAVILAFCGIIGE